MARVTGKVTRLLFLPAEVDVPNMEILDQDGRQVFYATPDGLGSTNDMTSYLADPEFTIECSDGGEG